MAFNQNRDAVTQQYAKLARDYDSRWSFYVQATTQATIHRLPSVLGSTLDIGCGTGALLSRLVAEFPESAFTGVDASTEMLELARTRLPANVSLDTCWAEDLPFDDCSFDTIVSCNMFHFIRCPDAALDEMFRVLRPGGTLVITDWCDDYITCKLCDIYLRWFDRAHNCMYGESKCRQLLLAASANSINIDKYRINWLWGMMTAIAHKGSSIDTTLPDSSLRNAR
jgi:ubiquinone/menaquinone biosynthesis C-methylase UbiE